MTYYSTAKFQHLRPGTGWKACTWVAVTMTVPSLCTTGKVDLYRLRLTKTGRPIYCTNPTVTAAIHACIYTAWELNVRNAGSSNLAQPFLAVPGRAY